MSFTLGGLLHGVSARPALARGRGAEGTVAAVAVLEWGAGWGGAVGRCRECWAEGRRQEVCEAVREEGRGVVDLRLRERGREGSAHCVWGDAPVQPLRYGRGEAGHFAGREDEAGVVAA